MMDKIKTTNQLNNMVLTSMQPINNKNLRFAGKILTKYGVSRGTDHFMALVLRRYSNLFAETKGVGSVVSPSRIKNNVNYLNVHNHIVNWTWGKIQRLNQCDIRYVPALSESSQGESGSAVREKGSRQGRNVFAETGRFSSSAGTGLLERILTQGKDIVTKPVAPGISNVYLIHSIRNIAHNTMLGTAAENSPSLTSVKPGRRSIGERERTFQGQALRDRVGAVEMVQGSKETSEKSRELLQARVPDEAEDVSKLIFERVSRFEAKTLPYLLVQRNIVGLKSGGQYINTAAVKAYLSNSRAEHNRQIKGIMPVQDDGVTVLHYSARDIVEENAAKLHFGNELTHKALYKAGMNQEEIDISSHNKITRQGGLVLHKPIKAETAAEGQKPKQTGFYDKTASSPTLGTRKQTQAVKNIDSQDISLLADRVFKILEKRIAIQKDRRGLL
jgi:hypothetical protein